MIATKDLEYMRKVLNLPPKSMACALHLHGDCGAVVNGGETEGIPCLCHCHETLEDSP